MEVARLHDLVARPCSACHACKESNDADCVIDDDMRQIYPKIRTENWPREYNEIRPHGSLGYRPPAPQTRIMIPTLAFAGGGRLD